VGRRPQHGVVKTYKVTKGTIWSVNVQHNNRKGKEFRGLTCYSNSSGTGTPQLRKLDRPNEATDRPQIEAEYYGRVSAHV
jgi:hypothetical protein